MSELFKVEQEQLISQIEESNQLIKKIKDNNNLQIASSSQIKELEEIYEKNQVFQKKLASNEFEIAIVGLEKAGKSTFANALIENMVLPSAPERCTFTTTRLVSGTDKAIIEFYSMEEFNRIFQNMLIELDFPNADTMHFQKLDEHEFKYFFENLEVENPSLYKNHVGRTDNEILDILKNRSKLKLDSDNLEFHGDELVSEEFQSYIKGEGDDTAKPRSVKRIEIQSSKLNQIKNAIIYDVPGFDSPTKLHIRQTEERLKKADAIILVTNVGTNPSIQGTSLSVIRNNSDDDGIELKDKLFVFGNQIDRVNRQEDIEGNTNILLKDVQKYGIGDHKNVFIGSARKYLIDKNIINEKFEFAYEIDSGIESIRSQLVHYYETERFEILKRKIDTSARRLKNIFKEIYATNSSLEHAHANNPDAQRGLIISSEQNQIKKRIKESLMRFKHRIKQQIYEEEWLSQNIKDEINNPQYFQEISEVHFDHMAIITDDSVRRDIAVQKVNSSIRQQLHIRYLEQYLDLIKNITNNKCNAIESELVNEFCLAVRGESNNNPEVNQLCESLIKKITTDIAHSAQSFIYLIERFSRDVFDIALAAPLASNDRSDRFKQSSKDIFHLDHYYSNGSGELFNLLMTQEKSSLLSTSIMNVAEIAKYFLKNANALNLPQIKVAEIQKFVTQLTDFNVLSHVNNIPNINQLITESKIQISDTKEKVVKEINTDINNIKNILIQAVVPAINLELAFFNSVDKQVKLLISALENTDNRHTLIFNSFLSTVIPIVKKQELDNISEIIRQQEIKQEIIHELNKV